ncbi:MAG: IS200/IS605 family transposase [Candidatus Cloacimonadota bacterium]|nr:MAG: IS200/IS605 family transposase [Candidatus Cloacimonadota bacterium]
MNKHSMKVCWLHLIWSTKDRFPYFSDIERARKVIEIFKDICIQNEIYYKIGYVNSEHVHLLVDLPVKLSIEKMMQFLKGTSSHTINEKGIFTARFSWAKRYAAFSVSNSQVSNIIQYIMNQKEHHKRVSFKEEWEQYMKKYDVIKSP